MCEIYVKADPILYEARSRSVRIHGVVTSLRLENLFWDTLAQIAARDGMTTNQLIAKLYDELIEHRGEVPNLASFLRVSCMRYLSLQASGSLPEPAATAPMRPERHTLQ
jgi:predicted DNA-binding ribbon-helix-helix protein